MSPQHPTCPLYWAVLRLQCLHMCVQIGLCVRKDMACSCLLHWILWSHLIVCICMIVCMSCVYVGPYGCLYMSLGPVCACTYVFLCAYMYECIRVCACVTWHEWLCDCCTHIKLYVWICVEDYRYMQEYMCLSLCQQACVVCVYILVCFKRCNICECRYMRVCVRAMCFRFCRHIMIHCPMTT